MVECLLPKQKVGGSNPPARSQIIAGTSYNYHIGLHRARVHLWQAVPQAWLGDLPCCKWLARHWRSLILYSAYLRTGKSSEICLWALPGAATALRVSFSVAAFAA